MQKTFDGKSFKRTPNPAGQNAPATGVSKDRIVATAVGGETTLALNFSYHPGKNMISVKRTTVPSMISGVHYTEIGPSVIQFATPLEAGESVEVVKELSVTAVMAVSSRNEVYTEVSDEDQTLFVADFMWAYNQNSLKSRGAVRVEVDGVAKERDADYIEVAPTSGTMTNKVQFIVPLEAGKKVTLLPTNLPIDNSSSLTTQLTTDVLDLKDRVTAIENEVPPEVPVPFANFFSPAFFANPNDPNYVQPQDTTTSSTSLILIPGASFNFTSTGGLLAIQTYQKLRYPDTSMITDFQMVIRVYNNDTNQLWSSREITSAGLNPNGTFTHIMGESLTRPVAGDYRLETWIKCWDANPVAISPWFRMTVKELK